MKNKELIVNALNLLADNEYAGYYNKPDVCESESEYSELSKLFDFIICHNNELVQIESYTNEFKILINKKQTFFSLKTRYKNGVIMGYVFELFSGTDINELKDFRDQIFNDLNGDI